MQQNWRSGIPSQNFFCDPQTLLGCHLPFPFRSQLEG